MYLAVSLVLALLFALGLSRSISKHSPVWYGISVAVVTFEAHYYALGWEMLFPKWFTVYIMQCFARGAFASALFVLVMFTGVLKSDWGITRKLRRNRGELSIIACLLTLGHNILYGTVHFVKLFTDPFGMEPRLFIAAIISLILIVIMLPLMVTSFKSVRKRLSADLWKRIQKWAYVFYGLLYVHVMVLFLPYFNVQLLNIIVYTAVFGSYLVIKVSKGMNKAP